MRVVLDANVLVSALLSRAGAPARLVSLWLDAAFDLVVCAALLAEVERALAHPKVRKRIDRADGESLVMLLRESAELVSDPEGEPPLRSEDPADDYLLALAEREQVPLVSADKHLLALSDRAPIFSPREFLDQLDR